jgi:hypothetical protein
MSNTENPKCCGQIAQIQPDKHNEIDGFGIWCNVCKHSLFRETKEQAIKDFMVDAKKGEVKKVQQNERVPMNRNNQLQITPLGISKIFENKKDSLAIISSPVLTGDKPAMARYVNNNTERYPMTLKSPQWDKIWATPEGQQSIITGIENSLIDCVELGVTGDLVPMGKTCILIAGVDSFIFRLTHGNNAPFENITIENIYEDDEVTSGRKNGSFFIDVNFGKTRKKVVSVAVYGELKKAGIIVGEMYDAERLLEKAELHSKPYANYMKMIKAYEYQKSEGKAKRDPNGREFFTYFDVVDSTTDQYFDRSVDFFRGAESRNELKKDNNGEYANQVITPTFTKKIYRSYIEGGTTETTVFLDSLVNPYAGADQPEMLRKTAGKSFLAKYAKVRNSEAAMHEVRSSKDAIKESMDLSENQFEDLKNVNGEVG